MIEQYALLLTAIKLQGNHPKAYKKHYLAL